LSSPTERTTSWEIHSGLQANAVGDLGASLVNDGVPLPVIQRVLDHEKRGAGRAVGDVEVALLAADLLQQDRPDRDHRLPLELHVAVAQIRVPVRSDLHRVAREIGPASCVARLMRCVGSAATRHGC
jgi:hypothetical protein